jgi:DNA-directed RNA polymerase subunit E'/Rpb7
MVRLRDITDDFYVLDEKNYCIIGQRKKKVYQLGDEVMIRVKKVDLSKRQIDFTLIPDEPAPIKTEKKPEKKKPEQKAPKRRR